MRTVFFGSAGVALSRMRDGVPSSLKPSADLVLGIGFANPFGKDMRVAQHPRYALRFHFAHQPAFFRVTAFDVHVFRHQFSMV